jgi:hypothetical protein
MNEFDKGPDLRLHHTNLGDRAVLAHCLSLIEDQPNKPTNAYRGCAVEFGVGGGDSLRMIAAVMPVIGFDSFEGLPEDWRPSHRKGFFGDAKIPTNVTGATIVPGWFEDTVPGYDWPENLALVHFDADLYSSTLTALDSIGPAIKPGCILVFDEFFGYDDDFKGTMPGEQQAFWEWCETADIMFDVIGHGREQWACVIR